MSEPWPRTEAMVFTAIIYALALFMPRWMLGHRFGLFGRTVCSQTLMLGLSLATMIGFGFRRRQGSTLAHLRATYALVLRGPKQTVAGLGGHPLWFDSLMLNLGLALVLGAAATAVGIAVGAANHPAMQAMRPAQALFLVLILAPVSEELMCRGWLQGHWSGDPDSVLARDPGRRGSGIWVSAGVFAAMHGQLFGRMGAIGGSLVVSMALILGLLAASVRERSSSLLGPILMHLSANLGGLMAGVGYTLMQMALARGTMR